MNRSFDGGTAYTLTRKRMKNIRIRVTGEGRVAVSAPYHVPVSRIEAFLKAHGAFVAQRLRDVEEKRSAHYPPRYADGDTFSFMGMRFYLRVCNAQRSRAVLSEDTLSLYLPAGAGREEARALFARWVRKQAARVFSERLVLLLPEFSGQPGIRLSVRDMITRWGSLNAKRRTMSLSVHLLRCETQLIDYVIAHELCHLTHSRHSAAFYAALEAKCPERRAMDEQLKTYGLVGF